MNIPTNALDTTGVLTIHAGYAACRPGREPGSSWAKRVSIAFIGFLPVEWLP